MENGRPHAQDSSSSTVQKAVLDKKVPVITHTMFIGMHLHILKNVGDVSISDLYPSLFYMQDWYMREEWFVTHILVGNAPPKYASYTDWGTDKAPTACFVEALRSKRSVWRKAAASALGGLNVLDDMLSKEEAVKDLLTHLDVSHSEDEVCASGCDRAQLLGVRTSEISCQHLAAADSLNGSSERLLHANASLTRVGYSDKRVHQDDSLKCMLPPLLEEVVAKYRKHMLTPFDSAVVRAVTLSMSKV